jgi:integrase
MPRYLFGLAPSASMPHGMTYIVHRKDRFYVVAYDGLDPITGRERRRWHPAGTSRADAEAVADRINERSAVSPQCSLSLGGFILQTWLPRKRAHVRATTAHRYAWIASHYVVPRLGRVPLVSLRSEHLDDLYEHLLTRGGRNGGPLAPKTVHEAHLIIRNALDLAAHRQLVDRNVALSVHSPRRRGGGTTVARVWNAQELRAFLKFARSQRLYPALHLAAHTGMRRGEVVGLKWADLDTQGKRVSICRTIQSLAGRPVEFGAKTRTSRRCVDLDDTTAAVLNRWRRRLTREQLPHGVDDWMFCNTTGRFLNPESISQLFARTRDRSGLPRIRFHDLRHTHASLLVAHGVPIKVVTERLGHAHPAFTMHTYQHLLPGMSAEAANRFAQLVADANR